MRQTLLTTLMALLCAAAALLGPAAEPVRADDGLDEARALIKEATPFYETAMNAGLSGTARKKARQEAHEKLMRARDLFDAYLDANPSKTEDLDTEYVDMRGKIYWIRKFASNNEFSAGGAPEKTEEEEAADAEAAKEKADGWKDKPGPGQPPPNAGDGGDAGGGSTPPQPDASSQARDAWEKIDEYRRFRPGDVQSLKDMCEDYLARFDDTSLPEYTKVALLLGAVTDKLNALYKKDFEEDPDLIKGVDSKNLLQAIVRLQKVLLSNGSPLEDRILSARLLGETRSGEASFPLVKSLSEEDPELNRVIVEGLVAIGGGRMAENLTKQYRNSSSDELQLACVDILTRVAGKSTADAKAVSLQLGRWVLSKKDRVAGKALDYLSTLGPAAGPGLVEALTTNLPAKQVEVILAIGNTKYYPAAKDISNYLIIGDNPRANLLRDAARKALVQMGPCAIPGMIPYMGSGRHKGHIGLTLKEMTGRYWGSKGAAELREWYEENKPSTGCD